MVPESIETLASLLRMVHRFAGSAARGVMHEYGMPPQSPQILGQISHHPGTTVSEIARKTGLAKSYVSNTVDALCEMGFVERCEDPVDQRLVRLHPSVRAREHLERVQAAVVHRLSSAVSSLPPETLAAMIAGLQALLNALETDSGSGDDRR